MAASTRAEAATGTGLTTRRNEWLPVDEPLVLFVMQRLDGTRTIADLAREAVEQGIAQAVTDEELRTEIWQAVVFASRAGFLIA